MKPAFSRPNAVGNILTALAAIMGAEHRLLNMLKGVDADALYNEIKSGRLLPVEPFFILAPFYHNNSESFEGHYTVEYILKKVRETRPDLWTLITACPGGIEWLAAQRSGLIALFK
jgi:hypothetical protein